MFFKKCVGVLLSASLIFTGVTPAFAQTPETVQAKLQAMEQDTYGQEQTGAIIERINRLEKDYDGKHRAGSMMSRVDALYDDLYANAGGPSYLTELNAIEWTVAHEVSMEPVQARVSSLEMSLSGKNAGGTFEKRKNNLSALAFGSSTLPLSEAILPANTLVKIALVNNVNVKDLKVGDKIAYTVAQDVTVNGMLVMAKGLPGEGTVTKVRQARNFGRNAELEIDFQKTKAMDGTYVDTFIGEEAKKEMKNLAMAAGASLAGMAILGPVGIIAGAFVKGKNLEYPAGTELYIQTKADTTLYGVHVAAE